MVDSVLPCGMPCVIVEVVVNEQACSVCGVCALLSVAKVGFEKIECTSFEVELLFEFVNQFYVTNCVKGFTEVNVDGHGRAVL